MRIGVPTEIKTDEARVALTPAGVRELTRHGHDVVVQRGAGLGSAITDEQYSEQGATIVADADAVFAAAELIVKVKEPQPDEVARLRPHHILFTYLHLAPAPELVQGLIASGATCIAYETITDAHGRLPLLAPMSEVAGRLAAQAGAFMLAKPLGGRGVLFGGVPGVPAARVMVIGGGVVGLNAARIAQGMGADVQVYDRSIDRLRELDLILGAGNTVFASTLSIEQGLPEADVVIGAVLVHGARAPHVVSRAQLALMKPGAVLVDVAIDQGGCFETSTARRRTPTRSTKSTASATTAWRTCPARCRSRPPRRSRTRRCRTCSSSPTTACAAPSTVTRASPTASAWSAARSRASRSRPSRTCRSSPRPWRSPPPSAASPRRASGRARRGTRARPLRCRAPCRPARRAGRAS